MSNNPYMSTRPDWVQSDRIWQRPTVPEQRLDDRSRCRVCDVSMTRLWYFVDVDGATRDTAENKFDRDDFCSVRCLKRRLNGLPNDDERAMTVLLRRVEYAGDEARDAGALTSAYVQHQERIRTALASVLELAPGLAEGEVPPPGAALAGRVAMLQSLVAQHVYANPDRPDRPVRQVRR